MLMPAIGAERPFLRSSNMVAGVRAGLHAVDDAADRVDRLEQAPERAEQAEEHQQADQIAVELAALVEARADRIEDGARS